MGILQCKFSAFFIVTIHLIVFSPLLSQTHWETAIYAEDVWSYFVGTNAPPDNWNELSFDTSNWSSGQGGFGYADEDDNTVIPNTLSVFFASLLMCLLWKKYYP